MTTPAALVREFHATFALRPDPERPTWRQRDVRDLRLSLMHEEMAELDEAMRGGSLTDIAKELADLVYVVYGTALAYGIDLDAAIAEVHRSNMSKRGPGGKVLRREDGKVLKGPGYQPPDMFGAVYGVAA